MKLKIGVIFGGESVEHEVSIISAVQAMKAMDEEKYDIVPIYISKDKVWYTGKLLKDLEIYKDMYNLKKFAKNVVLYNKNNQFVLQSKKGLKLNVDTIDIAFPIVHGANVEDGTLQGFLETVGVPYVGSNVFASAVGQDKIFMKQIFESSKIPVVDYVWFYDKEFIDSADVVRNKIKRMGYPVIVKPAKLGSSIGISKVKSESELDEAINSAILYDEKIIVEKVVDNLVEVNCSVLGNYEKISTSELEEVMGNDDFLSYKDKYLGGKSGNSKGMASTNRIIPARIDEKLYDEIKKLSELVFKTLNCSGVSRIDFLVDKKEKKVFVNEINTIPGSLSFYLWEKSGKDYSMLLDELIDISIKNYRKKDVKTNSFDSNILQNYNGTKGKLKI